MTKYCYILTEGAQDVALLIKLLRFEGIKQIQKRSQVDSFWDELIPKTFPYNDELNKQVPVPKFLQSNDLSIAIQSAVGDTRLVDTLQEDLTLIAKEDLAGIGIVLDADNCEPQTRLERIKTGIDKLHLEDVWKYGYELSVYTEIGWNPPKSSLKRGTLSPPF